MLTLRKWRPHVEGEPHPEKQLHRGQELFAETVTIKEEQAASDWTEIIKRKREGAVQRARKPQ